MPFLRNHFIIAGQYRLYAFINSYYPMGGGFVDDGIFDKIVEQGRGERRDVRVPFHDGDEPLGFRRVGVVPLNLGGKPRNLAVKRPLLSVVAEARCGDLLRTHSGHDASPLLLFADAALWGGAPITGVCLAFFKQHLLIFQRKHQQGNPFVV
jgi:hypothetical protein